jgi:hypothetical protein
MILIRKGASRTLRSGYTVEIEFYTNSETSVTVISEHITNKSALTQVEKIVKWCRAMGIDCEFDVL